MPTVKLSESLTNAPLNEVERNLPALIALTESSDDRTRTFAELSLLGVEGMAGDSPRIDTERSKLLLPYLDRFPPRLFDAATAAPAILLLNTFAAIRPLAPGILPLLTHALDDPRSTQPLLSPQHTPDSPGFIVGPDIVYILLQAGATFHLDPATHIIEGSDSPEIQQIIRRFLHRSDQTSRSISETIHTLALAQPQNPELNADLLRFLDSDDPALRLAILNDLPRLTFPPSDFAAAKEHLKSLASDPAASPQFRATAQTILGCWNNDRHHDCIYVPDAVNVH